MPSVNSKVYYFPQGHAEHSQSHIDFGSSSKIPPFVLSRVASVKFLADPETDEVFAKILLVPIQQHELDINEDEQGVSNVASELHEKPSSFAKTLTQSDANNGGGFSVPRYCAETIFPKLDYTADPPVQTILAKDVHGEVWKFRHIYRGTPRRHLLTTGWSTFLNQKKLVAGDSIVFLRAENGDLCVGIRRAKKGIGCGPEQPTGWNPPQAYGGGGVSMYSREEENNNSMRMMRNNASLKTKSRVMSESVIEAARLAASGQPFEIVYYPRASTPEFCVKVGAVRAAMRVQWCPGMRFKMAFETEDSSRISWFMGTISSVHAADPIHWPNSPWRLLQVAWDEPDLLQNVKRVSPWLVELVSNMPAIHLSPFSPPRKKLCIPSNSEFTQNNHHFPPLPTFISNPHGPYKGIQGARHANNYSGGGCGVGGSGNNAISIPDFHFKKLQPGLFHPGFLIRSRHQSSEKLIDDDISCLLTIGCPGMNSEKLRQVNVKKASQLVLFGKPIYTEEQISLSSGAGSRYSSSEGGNTEKSSDESLPSKLEVGHCKVYKEHDDVGRDLDLSLLGSYEELYMKLADTFGLDKSVIIGRLCYQDVTGSVKLDTGAPFSEFAKRARRLTIVMDSSSCSSI
nr:auxin response factor 16 [Allium sativum]